MSGTSGHDLVLDLLAEMPPGRLLDIPAGGGPVAAGARARGHRVVGVDLFPAPGLEGCVADACAPLPFRDASFDALVSLEGIEHFEDQAGFLRECARVLRPGGRLVLTTPNVLHLSSRAAAFLTGQRLLKQGIVNEVSTLRHRDGARLYHGHAFLIDAFRLRYLMRVAGLRLERVLSTAASPSSLLMAPLHPLLWLATRACLSAGRRRLERAGRAAPTPQIEGELAALATSPAVLFGKKLVYVARREGAPQPEAERAVAGAAGSPPVRASAGSAADHLPDTSAAPRAPVPAVGAGDPAAAFPLTGLRDPR